MPRFYLNEAGIIPESDFSTQPNYSGSHDKTWKLVETGAFEAGALNEAVWESAVEENKVDLSKVEVFYVTPDYYDYNWTINDIEDDFGEGSIKAVQDALLSFGEAYPETMALFSDDSFIKSSNDNYKAIEAVAKDLKLVE